MSLSPPSIWGSWASTTSSSAADVLFGQREQALCHCSSGLSIKLPLWWGSLHSAPLLPMPVSWLGERSSTLFLLPSLLGRKEKKYVVFMMAFYYFHSLSITVVNAVASPSLPVCNCSSMTLELHAECRFVAWGRTSPSFLQAFPFPNPFQSAWHASRKAIINLYINICNEITCLSDWWHKQEPYFFMKDVMTFLIHCFQRAHRLTWD